jgi:hypothetical protein
VYRSEIKHINFVLNGGGIGDDIATLPAIKYICQNQESVIGHFFVHDYIVELYNTALSEYLQRGRLTIDPLSSLKTTQNNWNKNYKVINPSELPLNNLATHLTDYAFTTLCNRGALDSEKDYLQVDFSKHCDISKFNLPEKYAVVTTGFTSKTREWNSNDIKNVCDYLINLGITPVFLGKDSMTEEELFSQKQVIGKFNAELDKGINLVNKTSLIESGAIIQQSCMILGLDNGLLHLAAMTEVPIIYGFTSVNPKHRLPYRRGSFGWDCYVVEPDVSCRGCQSNMVFENEFNFTDCFYKDFRCTKELNFEKWKVHIDSILKLDIKIKSKKSALLIGADPNGSRDGIIVKGIKNLLQDFEIDYATIDDHKSQSSVDFFPDKKFDSIVYAGTPNIWDQFWTTDKHKNTMLCREVHPESKMVYLGIGSCVNKFDQNSHVLRDPISQECLRKTYRGTSVIVRDLVAKNILDEAGVDSEFLPCPSYFCHGYFSQEPKGDEVAFFYFCPENSISSGQYSQYPELLQRYYQISRYFIQTFNPVIYANKKDAQVARSRGLEVITINNPDEMIEISRRVKYCLSGRVHYAVPCLVSGAQVGIIGIDSRSRVLTDFGVPEIRNQEDCHNLFRPKIDFNNLRTKYLKYFLD